MRCLRCQFETPGDARVCGRCGAPLPGPGGPIDPSETRTAAYSSAPLSDGVLFAGRYLVIEELGKGGMGCVYRAHDTQLDEEVALKFINPDIATDAKVVRRFQSELKITRKIIHRHVCRTYDIGQEGSSLYITMEYIPGEDLANMIRRLGRLPVEKAFLILKQVCEGLAEVHRLGIVHRDLKPRNIRLDPEGEVKIMDFGLARTPHGIKLTEVGHVVGTLSFMSPEQLNGETVTPGTDIFALGVTMYEVLTGQLPFKAETAIALALEHQAERPPSPRVLNPGVPDDLARIVMRCLEVDRSARYADAQELLTDLAKAGRRFEAYAFRVPLAAGAKPVKALADLWKRHRPRIFASVSAVLVLSVLGLAVRALLNKPHAPEPPSAVVKVETPAEAPLASEAVTTVPFFIATTPTGASIEIDGIPRGSSDAAFDLAPGAHTVKVRKPGFQELTQTFDFEAGGTSPLRREFKLISLPPATGVLEVVSEPPGAQVFVGDNMKSAGEVTPLSRSVPAGNIRVTLRLPGYQDLTELVNVRAGGRALLRGSLKPLDGTVTFHSEPEGADVYLGNELIGTTPFTRALAPKVYRLRVVLKGVGEKEDFITVNPGEMLALPAYAFTELAKPVSQSPRYFLKITTIPSGARVTIDGAPQKELTPFVWEVTNYEVHLTIEKESYKPLEEVVFLKPLPARNERSFELEKRETPRPSPWTPFVLSYPQGRGNVRPYQRPAPIGYSALTRTGSRPAGLSSPLRALMNESK